MDKLLEGENKKPQPVSEAMAEALRTFRLVKLYAEFPEEKKAGIANAIAGIAKLHPEEMREAWGKREELAGEFAPFLEPFLKTDFGARLLAHLEKGEALKELENVSEVVFTKQRGSPAPRKAEAPNRFRGRFVAPPAAKPTVAPPIAQKPQAQVALKPMPKPAPAPVAKAVPAQAAQKPAPSPLAKPAMPFPIFKDDAEFVLRDAKSIAIAGFSPREDSESRLLSTFFQVEKLEVFIINPFIREYGGRKCYGRLEEIEKPVDVVLIFRPFKEQREIVESAVKIGAKAVWNNYKMDSTAKRIAERAGLPVAEGKSIMRCYLEARPPQEKQKQAPAGEKLLEPPQKPMPAGKKPKEVPLELAPRLDVTRYVLKVLKQEAEEGKAVPGMMFSRVGEIAEELGRSQFTLTYYLNPSNFHLFPEYGEELKKGIVEVRKQWSVGKGPTRRPVELKEAHFRKAAEMMRERQAKGENAQKPYAEALAEVTAELRNEVEHLGDRMLFNAFDPSSPQFAGFSGELKDEIRGIRKDWCAMPNGYVEKVAREISEWQRWKDIDDGAKKELTLFITDLIGRGKPFEREEYISTFLRRLPEGTCRQLAGSHEKKSLLGVKLDNVVRHLARINLLEGPVEGLYPRTGPKIRAHYYIGKQNADALEKHVKELDGKALEIHVRRALSPSLLGRLVDEDEKALRGAVEETIRVLVKRPKPFDSSEACERALDSMPEKLRKKYVSGDGRSDLASMMHQAFGYLSNPDVALLCGPVEAFAEGTFRIKRKFWAGKDFKKELERFAEGRNVHGKDDVHLARACAVRIHHVPRETCEEMRAAFAEAIPLFAPIGQEPKAHRRGRPFEEHQLTSAILARIPEKTLSHLTDEERGKIPQRVHHALVYLKNAGYLLESENESLSFGQAARAHLWVSAGGRERLEREVRLRESELKDDICIYRAVAKMETFKFGPKEQYGLNRAFCNSLSKLMKEEGQKPFSAREFVMAALSEAPEARGLFFQGPKSVRAFNELVSHASSAFNWLAKEGYFEGPEWVASTDVNQPLFVHMWVKAGNGEALKALAKERDGNMAEVFAQRITPRLKPEKADEGMKIIRSVLNGETAACCADFRKKDFGADLDYLLLTALKYERPDRSEGSVISRMKMRDLKRDMQVWYFGSEKALKRKEKELASIAKEAKEAEEAKEAAKKSDVSRLAQAAAVRSKAIQVDVANEIEKALMDVLPFYVKIWREPKGRHFRNQPFEEYRLAQAVMDKMPEEILERPGVRRMVPPKVFHALQSLEAAGYVVKSEKTLSLIRAPGSPARAMVWVSAEHADKLKGLVDERELAEKRDICIYRALSMIGVFNREPKLAYELNRGFTKAFASMIDGEEGKKPFATRRIAEMALEGAPKDVRELLCADNAEARARHKQLVVKTARALNWLVKEGYFEGPLFVASTDPFQHMLFVHMWVKAGNGEALRALEKDRNEDMVGTLAERVANMCTKNRAEAKKLVREMFEGKRVICSQDFSLKMFGTELGLAMRLPMGFEYPDGRKGSLITQWRLTDPQVKREMWYYGTEEALKGQMDGFERKAVWRPTKPAVPEVEPQAVTKPAVTPLAPKPALAEPAPVRIATAPPKPIQPLQVLEPMVRQKPPVTPKPVPVVHKFFLPQAAELAKLNREGIERLLKKMKGWPLEDRVYAYEQISRRLPAQEEMKPGILTEAELMLIRKMDSDVTWKLQAELGKDGRHIFNKLYSYDTLCKKEITLHEALEVKRWTEEALFKLMGALESSSRDFTGLPSHLLMKARPKEYWKMMEGIKELRMNGGLAEAKLRYEKWKKKQA